MMASVGMLIVLMDFGLTTVMVREVSRDRAKLPEYMINLSFIKILFGFIAFLLVLGVGYYIGDLEISISLILVYCLYSILNNFSEFLRAFFRPSEDMQHEAYLKVLNGIVFIGVLGFILMTFPSLENIIYGYCISAIFGLISTGIYVYNTFDIKKIRLDKNIIFFSLRRGLYIGLGSFFIALYMSSDQIIMGMYSQFDALGVYALAYKCTLILAMASGIIFTSIFPRISQDEYLKGGIQNYKQGLWMIFRYNFLLILTLEFVLLASYSLNLGQYQASIPILQFLLIYNLIEPLGYWGYINLVSLGREAINLYIVMVVGILNVIGNIFLIPIYSYYGAICTTIFSYILYFLCVNSVILGKYLVKK
ncbi:oligosaccharide flippase family protein [Candidatus Gracilibacteria bacterium]|nr:oligosaccharide flippase family protein [Candidatus Gracilibacteria bacterium]